MEFYSRKKLKEMFNLYKVRKVEPFSAETCNITEDCSNIREHTVWGAYVDKNSDVTFKTATFADTDSVSVEIKPRDKRVFKVLPLEKKCNGIFELTVNKKIAKPGDKYRFIIDRPGKPKVRVRDPYSARQDNLIVWSIIYNHNNYKWHDGRWMSRKNSAKVSRLANEDNKLKPVGALRIYEVNIPSLTDKGTYSAAKRKFTEAKNNGFNAVQIMPLENSYGYNWGYDGVDKFAPHKTYGSPDDLKELIDFAHHINLNVIMDIVPNHIGEDTCDIINAGPYTDGCNEFGLKFNFEKEYNFVARNYIINAALNWLINYHCDGLRLDLTKYMNSDNTMKQLSLEVHHHVPDAFLIAEDARENDPRVTTPFSDEERHLNAADHCAFSKLAAENGLSLQNLGYESEWDFPFHKQIAALMLDYWSGYPKSTEAFGKIANNSGMRVKYPMSHDEIGNVDGTRLITKIFAKEINIYKNIPKTFRNIREQRFAHSAHRILRKLLTGEIEKMPPKEFAVFAKKNFLALSVTPVSLKTAYRKALTKYRLALGAVYSVPGPKMIFQGDEKGEMTYFKFFRELSCGYEKLLESKGYKPGEAAFKDSKLGSISYSRKYAKDNDNTLKFVRNLNFITNENIALQTGTVNNIVSHPISAVIAFHSVNNNNEIFSAANFSQISYYENYKIIFPPGKWREILNSDSEKFGAEGNFTNRNITVSDGVSPSKISLPGFGITFFKKID